MRHIYEYSIFERKQSGILYHFTTPSGVMGILKEDRMRSELGHISFTRNPDLRSWYEQYDSYVRITFDGTAMSDRFRIQPHLYKPKRFEPIQDTELFGDEPELSYPDRLNLFKDEREETIMRPEISGVCKYIVQIDILKQYRQGNYERLRDSISKLTDKPVELVDRFRPAEKIYMAA